MASKLANFLSNSAAKDDKGRRLAWILSQNDDYWEQEHDFIQWVFPLPTASEAVPNSPVLTHEDCFVLGTRPRFRKNYGAANLAVIRFMSYLGLKFGRNAVFVINDLNVWRWKYQFNHNHLRITRFLKWMRIIGRLDDARSVVAFMKTHGPLEPTSLEYWEEAVK